MPDQDAIVAITSESFDMQASMNIIWKNLLPAFQDFALPQDEDGQRSVASKISSLAMLPPAFNASSDLVKDISGKQFTFEENDYGIKSITVNYSDAGCQVEINKIKSEVINCGIQQWIEADQIKSPEDLYPIGAQIPVESKYVASATWKDENTLQVSLKFAETIHGEHVFLAFDDDKVAVSFLNSVAMGRGGKDERLGIEGRIIQI
ncbi:MAG: hypothetical protein O2887_04930 [Bacteroidetes bacterium]|nr:hypothetical protein [Bacteroidota bacterium]MDA1119827.1 hypothetical protein [Bacteroidota bacterium]